MIRVTSLGMTVALTVLLWTEAAAAFDVDQCVEARLPDDSAFRQGTVSGVEGNNISVSFGDGSGITVPVTWSDGQALVKACDAGDVPPVDTAPVVPATDDAATAGATCRDAASSCPATNDLQQDQLCAHNKVRSCEGLSALSWNAAVAESAQAWANRLESEGRMYHDQLGDIGGGIFVGGENIAPGDTSLKAFSLWTDEEPFYDEMVAQHGGCGMEIGEDYMRCGHWANIVSQRVTRLGCGMAGRYLVCKFAN